MARQAIAELQRSTSHALTIDDFAHIERLNVLARQIREGEDAPDVAKLPAIAGNVMLEAPTIRKLVWLHERGAAWCEGDPIVEQLLLPYVLSVDVDAAALASMTSPRQARAAVIEWAENVDATPDEIGKAVEAVWRDEEQDESDDKGASDYGSIIALLVREYGNTPDYWLGEAPIPIIRAMLKDYAATVQAKIEANRVAASKGGSKRPAPPVFSPKMRRLRRFRKLKEAIEKRWREQE